MYWGVIYKCFLFVSRYVVFVFHRCFFVAVSDRRLGQDFTPDNTWPFWLNYKNSFSHRKCRDDNDFVETHKIILFLQYRPQVYSVVLEVFLRFRKFLPRYSYKIYSYEKERPRPALSTLKFLRSTCGKSIDMLLLHFAIM